jgi:tRNA U34 2-thiouridine synthase MnmA/TrmU
LYVIKTDAGSNTVFVGAKRHLETLDFKVKRMNWFHPPTETAMLERQIKVRYAGEPTLGRLVQDPMGTIGEDYLVELAKPQQAVTPGQIAAIYDADFKELLGGGYIDAMIPQAPFDASLAKPLPDLNANCSI